MRWDTRLATADEPMLPGLPGLVRSVRTPEFAGMVFHEVRAKSVPELRVGEAIYGTERRGNYRRYVPTVVLDHWSTMKPAYRVSLEDGTQLIASGDHRFLTERGWKHVTGAMRGEGRRPHLTHGQQAGRDG